MNNYFNTISRRELIGATVAASTLLGTTSSHAKQNDNHPKSHHHLAKNQTILFQGDSITDAGRNKKEQVANKQQAFGKGYAWMAASGILVQNPKLNLAIHNRGISGNKVHQLAARWNQDCIALKPDLISILIGVNDIWHGLNGRYDGTVDTYEKDYDKLLESTRKDLPLARFVVCEPFVLKCGAVNDKWFPEFDGYREAARKIATNHDAIFVPFQSMFDEAIKFAPPQHWAGDGVHPSSHGAALMASFWIKSVLG